MTVKMKVKYLIRFVSLSVSKNYQLFPPKHSREYIVMTEFTQASRLKGGGFL